jgi:hypothetical protein
MLGVAMLISVKIMYVCMSLIIFHLNFFLSERLGSTTVRVNAEINIMFSRNLFIIYLLSLLNYIICVTQICRTDS